MSARILLLLLLLSAAPLAQAADLTVRFTGRFQPGTCSFSAPDVDVGTFQAPSFDTVPMPTPVSFTLRRTACAAELLTLHVRLAGAVDATSADYFAVPSTGGVRGIAIRISNPSNQVMRPNQPAFDWQTMGSADGGFVLRAGLVKTGTVTAGSIRAPITVQVTYN